MIRNMIENNNKLINKIKTEQPLSKGFIFGKKYLFTVILLFVILLTIYAISLFFFSIEESQLSLLLSGGFAGLEIFIYSLPWMLIILSLILIVFINKRLRSKSHMYRRPILYTLLMVSLFIIAGGYALAKTPLNKNIAEAVEKKQTPVIKDVYRNYIRRQIKNSSTGIVTDMDGNKIKVRNNKGEDVQIELKGKNKLNKNDSVLIINRNGKGKIIKIHRIKEQVRSNIEIK